MNQRQVNLRMYQNKTAESIERLSPFMFTKPTKIRDQKTCLRQTHRST